MNEKKSKQKNKWNILQTNFNGFRVKKTQSQKQRMYDNSEKGKDKTQQHKI